MVAIAKRLVSAHKISLLQREHFKATHDPLTGLINQVALDERIEHEIALGARYHKSFGVLMLEVRNFQEISQNYSKTAANNILIDFAKCLKSCLRGTDTVARLEGDMFVILLPDVNDAQNVVKVIQSINVHLLSPFTVNDNEFVLSANIGVSVYPEDGENHKHLMERAHVAMCQARSNDTKNYCYYSPVLEEGIQRQLRCEHEIRAAVDEHKYDIHYLPIQELATGKIAFVEADVVWHANELREMSKQRIGEHIESLELTKLFGDITLNDICQQMVRWENDKEFHGTPVIIALTSSQLHDVQLVTRFRKIIHNHGISANRIGITIREKDIIDHSRIAYRQISALKQAGFKIVIDEFSGGLSYIGNFASGLVDFIRLDATIMHELDNRIEWLCVVEGMLRIAYHLNISTIISGVHNDYQYTMLENVNCEYWQGDYSYLINHCEQMSLA